MDIVSTPDILYETQFQSLLTKFIFFKHLENITNTKFNIQPFHWTTFMFESVPAFQLKV